MPSYNYICPSKHKFEAFNSIENRSFTSCPKCNRMAEQTISRRPSAVHNFKYGEFDHITDETVYVKNKKHLKELCERHECYAPGVLD